MSNTTNNNIIYSLNGITYETHTNWNDAIIEHDSLREEAQKDIDENIDENEIKAIFVGFHLQKDWVQTTTISRCDVISPYNEQRIINKWIDDEDIEYETACIQLTLTTEYHNWHDTAVDRISNLFLNKNNSKAKLKDEVKDIDNLHELIKEVNRLITHLNQYQDIQKIDDNMTIEDFYSELGQIKFF